MIAGSKKCNIIIVGRYLFNLSICSSISLKVSKYSKLIKNEFIALYKSLSALRKNAILCPKILFLAYFP